MLVSRQAQAAGTTVKDAVQGRYLLVRSATNTIEVLAPGMGAVRLEEGDSYQFSDNIENFRIEITNPNATAVDWEIETSNHEIKPGKQAVSVSTTSIIQGANSVTNVGGVTVPAGSNALLIAGAAPDTSRTLRLSIKSDAAGGVYLGAAGIAAGQGGFLEAGMVDYVDCEAALYAYNPNGVDVVVQVLPFERAL
ncbi:MAG: hypothetical protein CL537_07730 [Alcanivoracaceae bacterium]|nr:hypothetical protein [Alcanivoracaceae bacterium]|tara:strand:+ start:743 stop:1324 length:582 start_codon:yes stop_codon:yes gene_type:complete